MTATAPICLTDRSVIRVGGADAHHFLQNLVTADIEVADKDGATAAALLTPQGKILFDFLIYRSEDDYLIDVSSDLAADLLKRLTFYRLRAKVDLELLDVPVFAILDGMAPFEGSARVAVTDPRLPALGYRLIATAADIVERSDAVHAYDARRIALGIPEGLKDYDMSDIFPHDADLDQLGGVSFKKGCYVGQEVVSRVQHRGTARKRFVMVESPAPLPAKGTPVECGGKALGTMGSSACVDGVYRGLALLRLDKVRQAIDNGGTLSAADAPLSVSLPDWAGFDWPSQADDTD